jgi:hypothetical protein
VVLKKVQPRKKPEAPVVARAATPEVRRAEPAPPAEAPEDEDEDDDSSEEASSTAQTTTNQSVDEEPAPVTTESSSSSSTSRNAAPSVASQPRSKKPVEVAKARKESKRVLRAEPADDFEGAPPIRSNSVRAKFIGMTPDGRMMLALPSREVVIVPPPPGYR